MYYQTLKKIYLIGFCLCIFGIQGIAQKITDSTAPLHLLQPDYKTPYGKPDVKEIETVLDRVYSYLEETTPPVIIDQNSGAELTDFNQLNENSIFKPGDFRLISYEWGVTYAGMLLATEKTGDERFADYAFKRMQLLADLRPACLNFEKKRPEHKHPMYSVIHPHALDDAGAMCAALIKAKRTGFDADLDSMIFNFMDYISCKQFRLEDGTLARNRPQPNSLWLDDLFMSVPALAQMGKYTGKTIYYDDAIQQVLQFSKRMFNYEKGLFMHGWIQGMDEHPQFYWGRANGWAIMAMVELLEVLPADYPGRDQVLDLLQRHVSGLAKYQSEQGFWHQLLDRNDSYLETSATAIYTYSIARAINRGYVDAKVYGPMVCLAWNAVASKVNKKGQVEGTCVGTGMGFDPAFYYYRPVNVYAAHGYGPVLLAGAEMIELIKTQDIRINDSAVQFYDSEVKKETSWKFDFGSGAVADGFIPVDEKSTYDSEKGFGIISEGTIQSKKGKGTDQLMADFVTSDQPFYFSVDVPEGRYKVTLTLANPTGNSRTTVKAESRRLMLEAIQPRKGESITKIILVDVRTPRINATEEIHRKLREMVYLNWDDKLTLEFNGEHPCVSAIKIEEANDFPVIFLAGNSTVVDQEYEPWASWGQMLPRFLKPEIVVANYAESGETLKAFRRENRLKKVLSVMKPGDYLLMEFAHNDQKPGGNHVEPFTTYQDELRYFINETRKRGAHPMLVTSTNRRKFDEQGKIVNTLEEYPEAMRQLAKEEAVPLIDLNAMSKQLYEALGVENSTKAFVHYPANTFPNQSKKLEDNTHFNPYGAYELAKCVVQQIKDKNLDLLNDVVDDFSAFNPTKPDDWKNFFWPQSPSFDLLKPDGN